MSTVILRTVSKRVKLVCTSTKFTKDTFGVTVRDGLIAVAFSMGTAKWTGESFVIGAFKS